MFLKALCKGPSSYPSREKDFGSVIQSISKYAYLQAASSITPFIMDSYVQEVNSVPLYFPLPNEQSH